MYLTGIHLKIVVIIFNFGIYLKLANSFIFLNYGNNNATHTKTNFKDTKTNNHLVCYRILNHLAKMVKKQHLFYCINVFYISCVKQTAEQLNQLKLHQLQRKFPKNIINEFFQSKQNTEENSIIFAQT